jgi:hypothetical protein
MLAPTWAATTIDVVPAHAGTHTPRLLLFCTLVDGFSCN